MTIVYLGLGSNLGARAKNLSAARRRLRAKGVRIRRTSRVRETQPWGVTDQPRFLNQVVEAEWTGTPSGLLRVTQATEREGGRRRGPRWGPRLIDVDILIFGDQEVSGPKLVIPHPRIAERDFVTVPLRELGVRLPSRAGRW